jgi:hypothetical protein
MKTTLAFVISLLSLVTTLTGFGQQNYYNLSPQMIRKTTIHYDGQVTYYSSNNNMMVIKGSPYFHDKFEKGKLITYKDTVRDIPIRYNIYNKNMEFLYNNDTMTITDIHKIKEVDLGDARFLALPFKRGNNQQGYGYLLELASGKYTLYVFLSKEIKQDAYVSNYMGGGGSGDTYFVDKPEYLIRIGDNEATSFAATKSGLKGIFPQYSSQITAYVKSHNLKLKAQNDLIDLIRYINTL